MRKSISLVVSTLSGNLRTYPRAVLHCINAYTLLQRRHMKRLIPGIIDALVNMQSQAKYHLAFLEFLSLLGRLPDMAHSLNEMELGQVGALVTIFCRSASVLCVLVLFVFYVFLVSSLSSFSGCG